MLILTMFQDYKAAVALSKRFQHNSLRTLTILSQLINNNNIIIIIMQHTIFQAPMCSSTTPSTK